MKKYIIIIFAFFLFSGNICAQNPIIWKKIYNSPYPRSVKDISIIDTSYYILSETIKNNSDAELLCVYKYNGLLSFSSFYGESNIDNPLKLILDNSSLYITGITRSTEGIFKYNHGFIDGFFIKTDLNGNLIDTTVFGGSKQESNTTSKINSNYYLSMSSSSSIDGDLSSCAPVINTRQWIYSHDSLGNIIDSYCNDTIKLGYNKAYLQNGHYFLFSSGTLTQAGGYTYNYPPNSQGNPGGPSNDFLLVEYDTNFNIINVKNYGSDSDEGLVKSIRTADKGFMLFGHTDYIHDTLEVSGGIGARDLYCVKLDSNANFQWSKCLGSLGPDDPLDICQTADNGYLVLGEIQQASGNVSNFYGQRDMWLAKIDSVGNLLWERTYGGSYFDRGNLVREDSDGTIVIVGTTQSTDGTFSGISIQGQSDMFIIKLAPWVGVSESTKTQINISVYPNPTRSGSTINLKGLPIKNHSYQLSIYNIQGQQLSTQQFNASYAKQIQLPNLSNGVYFIRLLNDEGVVRMAKFIVN